MPEPGFSLLSVFFLLGVAQAVFLALALLVAKNGNHRANVYLTLMLFVFAVDLFNEFMDNSLYGLRVLWLMFVTFPTDFLYGPLIWMYVRTLTGKSLDFFGHVPILHFLPFLLHGLAIWSKIPLSFSPDLLSAYPELKLGNEIQPWIMNEYFAIAAVFHIATYLVLGMVTLRKFRNQVGESFSYLEGVSLQWLRTLLGVLFTLYVLYVLRFVLAAYIGAVDMADVILNIGLVVVIYSLGYFGLRQPAIFIQVDQSGSGDEPDHGEKTVDQAVYSPDLDAGPEKYAKSSLSPERADTILDQLKDHMESARPYLNNKLVLSELSSVLGISPNHLSQVINEKLSQNFFDFVNNYRIEAAKRQLTEMDPGRYTILGLALDSGFNSKSAFYSVFRKHTGTTPTAYRKAHFEPRVGSP